MDKCHHTACCSGERNEGLTVRVGERTRPAPDPRRQTLCQLVVHIAQMRRKGHDSKQTSEAKRKHLRDLLEGREISPWTRGELALPACSLAHSANTYQRLALPGCHAVMPSRARGIMGKGCTYQNRVILALFVSPLGYAHPQESRRVSIRKLKGGATYLKHKGLMLS